MPTILQQVDSDVDAGFDPDPVPVALKVIYHDPVLFVAWGDMADAIDAAPFNNARIGFGHRVPVGDAAGGVTYYTGSFAGLDDSDADYVGLYGCNSFRKGTAAPSVENLTLSLPEPCQVVYNYVYPRDKLVAVLAIDGPSGEMTSVPIGSGASGSGTITGLTDEPSLVFLRYAQATDFGNASSIGFGACDPDLNQWSMSVSGCSFCGTIADARRRKFTSDRALHTLVEQGTQAITVEITGITSDGFTYNWTNTTGSAQTVFATVWYIPSGEVKVGVGTEGDTTLSTGFATEGAVYGSVQTDDETIQTGIYMSHGGGAKKGGQRVASMHAGVLFGDGQSRFETGVIRFAEGDGTAIDKATQVLGPSGMTLSWDDGTGGRLFGWYAWGETNSDPVPCPRGDKIHRYV